MPPTAANIWRPSLSVGDLPRPSCWEAPAAHRFIKSSQICCPSWHLGSHDGTEVSPFFLQNRGSTARACAQLCLCPGLCACACVCELVCLSREGSRYGNGCVMCCVSVCHRIIHSFNTHFLSSCSLEVSGPVRGDAEEDWATWSSESAWSPSPCEASSTLAILGRGGLCRGGQRQLWPFRGLVPRQGPAQGSTNPQKTHLQSCLLFFQPHCRLNCPRLSETKLHAIPKESP